MSLVEYGKVKDWIHEPLSEENRLFRLRAISKAFGLTEHYLRSRYMPDNPDLFAGMGHYLQLEIIYWIEFHPNLQINDPEFMMTDWADLNVDSD